MKFLTLDYIKQHSRLDCTCEGEILTLYGNAAEETLATYIGYVDSKGHPDVNAMLQDFNGTMPAQLMQAALMLVDVSYNNRAPISNQNMSAVPYTFDILVKPYVKL